MLGMSFRYSIKMKRNEFIKSLQIIKSKIIQSQKKTRRLTFKTENSEKLFFCSCVDGNGESKYLYHSQKEIEYLLSSKNISLQSYHCPYEKGWHLTKG